MNMNADQKSFVNERILAIKRKLLRAWWGTEEIYSNLLQHALPITVSTFSELHDFCDANCLGGLCDDAIVAEGEALFGRPETISQDSEWIDACNVVQNSVHAWLHERESVDAFALLVKSLNFEQVDCMLDDERTYDAHGMLDDLHARVGFKDSIIDGLRELLLPMPQWCVEFPTMAAEQIGHLGIVFPYGWKDASWHNDACPSFHNEQHKLTVFISDAIPEQREIPGDRFLLCRTDEDGNANGEVIYTSDEGPDMLNAINMIVGSEPQRVPEGLTRADIVAYVCQALEGSQEWAMKDDDMNAMFDKLMTTDNVLVTLMQGIPAAEWEDAYTLIVNVAPHNPSYPAL